VGRTVVVLWAYNSFKGQLGFLMRLVVVVSTMPLMPPMSTLLKTFISIYLSMPTRLLTVWDFSGRLLGFIPSYME
jgi:hypothetical protein